jgi:hypothetical protein
MLGLLFRILHETCAEKLTSKRNEKTQLFYIRPTFFLSRHNSNSAFVFYSDAASQTHKKFVIYGAEGDTS